MCGQSTWQYEIVDGEHRVSNIRIFLDPRRDGHVRLVIHELLHIYMSMLLSIDRRMVYELEEKAILGWEDCLYKYLHAPKREHLLESWAQAIGRKLNG